MKVGDSEKKSQFENSSIQNYPISSQENWKLFWKFMKYNEILLYEKFQCVQNDNLCPNLERFSLIIS